MVRHSQMMIESLSRVKEIVKQNNALSEHRAHFARPPLDDEYHRADEFGAGGFAGADAKKRRGVSDFFPLTRQRLTPCRKPHPPAAVTAVTAPKHPNGEEDQMVLVPFATLAACITPS